MHEKNKLKLESLSKGMKVLKKYPTEILEVEESRKEEREDRTSELKDGKQKLPNLNSREKRQQK